MEVVLFSYCLNTRYLLQVVDIASSNDIILEEDTSEIMPGEIDVIKSKELKSTGSLCRVWNKCVISQCN